MCYRFNASWNKKVLLLLLLTIQSVTLVGWTYQTLITEAEQGEPDSLFGRNQNFASSQSQHSPFSKGLVMDSSCKEDQALHAT